MPEEDYCLTRGYFLLPVSKPLAHSITTLILLTDTTVFSKDPPRLYYKIQRCSLLQHCQMFDSITNNCLDVKLQNVR